MTRCGVCGSNSVLSALRKPAASRAYSIVAHCMPRQMPKNGILCVSRVLDRVNHALNSAFAKPSGNEDAVRLTQMRLPPSPANRFPPPQPFDHGALFVRQAAVHQRLAQTFVRVFELHVLADHRDAHFALGIADAVQHFEPRLMSRACASRRSSRRICASRPSSASATGTP